MDYGIAILNTIGVTSTAQRAPRRYRSSYREQQARQTRRRILGAAASQFLAHGYAGTTIRGIAAEAEAQVLLVEATPCSQGGSTCISVPRQRQVSDFSRR